MSALVAFVWSRQQINLRAFGKQRLTRWHALPITEEKLGAEQGFTTMVEAPAFRFGFTELGKYLNSTSEKLCCIYVQPFGKAVWPLGCPCRSPSKEAATSFLCVKELGGGGVKWEGAYKD